jgi:phospholipid/cholesterol/gamma-HCH transport system substrate-binding protein
MGAFTLAAIVSVFAFVYWLNHAGGMGERSVYRIRFLGSVPGLRAGAAVQFNGIRVGEVTDVRLDAQTPQQVMATVSVDRGTPIRRDTQVALDFQGLMGVTSVALKGGSSESPQLTGEPPVLVADAMAGSDLTTTAKEALRRLDGILADNSESLRGTLGNLNAFTGALAKNSDRIDGIVSGLERMTGAEAIKNPSVSFDLAVPDALPVKGNADQTIAVGEPVSLLALDTQKIIVRSASGARTQMAGGAQWADTLPKLIQARILQALEKAASPKTVVRSSDNLATDRQLQLEIRSFDLTTGEKPYAAIEIAARIVADGNRVIDARTFAATSPAQSADGAGAVDAFNTAFGKVLVDLVGWAGEAGR